MAFIKPPGVMERRGGSFPSQSKAATDLVVTAPKSFGSHSLATSSLWPKVPEAATMGFGKSISPTRTLRSITIRVSFVRQRGTLAKT